MENNLPPVDLEESLADSGGFSNFFQDVSKFWNAFGTPLVGAIAVIAIVYAGYNLITSRAEASRQNAWIDLYSSPSPESLQLVVDVTKNPTVRAVANLRAADLLLAESVIASEPDAKAILGTARDHYQAALDDAPHDIFKLNALDGLGVVAESLYDTDQAQASYQKLKDLAGTDYPWWAALAERRLALLPDLAEAVVFAPEPVEEVAEDLETGDAADPSDAQEAVEVVPNATDAPTGE